MPATSKPNMELLFDKSKCIVCAGCVGICPDMALDFHGLEWFMDSSRCSACSLCVRVCPVGALKLEKQ
ncbi:MAG TPA: 4Fe-4S binding protein [Fibrobacteraceae bacterium]|nr:4Fe-4S binding protein [Fibrobacteraceae bacterium]